jgi:hypothetical protein
MGWLPASVPRITISRESDSRGCRYSFIVPASKFARPQIVPTAANTAAGQPGLLHPGLSCFITSTRTGYANRPNQVIDGTGTFTPPDSQPCRLLTMPIALAAIGLSRMAMIARPVRLRTRLTAQAYITAETAIVNRPWCDGRTDRATPASTVSRPPFRHRANSSGAHRVMNAS